MGTCADVLALLDAVTTVMIDSLADVDLAYPRSSPAGVGVEPGVGAGADAGVAEGGGGGGVRTLATLLSDVARGSPLYPTKQAAELSGAYLGEYTTTIASNNYSKF